MSIDASSSLIPNNIRGTLNSQQQGVFPLGRKAVVPKTLSEAHENVLSSMKSLSAARYVKVGDTHGKSGFSALGQILSNIGHNIRALFKGGESKDCEALGEAVCKLEQFAKDLSQKNQQQIREDIGNYDRSVGAGGKKVSEIYEEMKQIYRDIKNAKAMYIKNEDSTFLDENQREMLEFAKEFDENGNFCIRDGIDKGKFKANISQCLDEFDESFFVKNGIDKDTFKAQLLDCKFQTLIACAFQTVSGKRGQDDINKMKSLFEVLAGGIDAMPQFRGKYSLFVMTFSSYLENKGTESPSLADRLGTAVEDIFRTYKKNNINLLLPGTMTLQDPIKFLHS